MRVHLLLAFSLYVLVSVDANAHPDVEAGKAAMRNGDFRGALQKLDNAERSPELTEEDLVEVHFNRGVIHFTMGATQKAEKSFDQVIRLRPLYTPDRLETPPEIRALFARRAAEFQKSQGLTIGAPQVSGAALNVKLDGSVARASQLKVFARPPGATTYEQFEAPIVENSVAVVLGSRELWMRSAGKIEVVVEVRNSKNIPVARSGDAIAPLSVGVSPVQKERALNALAAASLPAEPPPVVTPPPEPAPAIAVVPPPVEKPAEPAPAPPPPARPVDEVPAPVEEPAGPPILRPVGGVLLAGGGALFVLSVFAGMAALASGAVWRVALMRLGDENDLGRVGADRTSERKLWEAFYWAGQAAVVPLALAAAALLVVTLVPLGAGIVALVLSFL